jgi:hypothetical protein
MKNQNTTIIDISKLACDSCGKTFNLATEGGVITAHMQAQGTECRACALETIAYDTRVNAAKLLLKPLELFITDSEGPFPNDVQDVGDPIPAILIPA